MKNVKKKLNADKKKESAAEREYLMKNLFAIIPEDFFRPLTGKYKKEYTDCIQLIFNAFKPEISYGVNREIVAGTLSDYFEENPRDITFDDEGTFIKDARGKANGVIQTLKHCGWLEYEPDANHQVNVVLMEYAIPIIESFNKIIREEEAEYQGIISQIHSSLQNQELYRKPYELIIKGVQENTERLVSELKKLNASIKRHMDKQTNQMEAADILEHFFEYQQNIGSKAYLRMKTSDNIAYFRSAIIGKLNDLISNQTIMDAAVTGYMEVEQIEDIEQACDELMEILLDIKSSFYRLDDIIDEIDKKHSKYMKNAVLRAKFKLSSGSNLEGKILGILSSISEELNAHSEMDIYDSAATELNEVYQIFPQLNITSESLKTIPISKGSARVNELAESFISDEERKLYKEVLKEKNRRRFSRKNINQYVTELLKDQPRIKASAIAIESRRDIIRLIYISIYGNNRSNNYTLERSDKKVTVGSYQFPDFEIIRSDK